MQITHEEARRLIQFNADQALIGVERNLLEDHLKSCLECRRYADSIQKLETVLGSSMKKKWTQTPLPHTANLGVKSKNSILTHQIFLATRIAAMGLLCIAFLFNIWQFTSSDQDKPNPSSSVPPVPTPSIRSTTTQLVRQDCVRTLYSVQEGDTLESISVQFSIPAKEIVNVNQLKENTLFASMNLIIPTCSSTPAGAARIIKTTNIPRLGTTTSTPLYNPTQ